MLIILAALGIPIGLFLVFAAVVNTPGYKPTRSDYIIMGTMVYGGLGWCVWGIVYLLYRLVLVLS